MKASLPLVLAMTASTASSARHYNGILTPHRFLARELSSFDLVSEILSTMTAQGASKSPGTTTTTLPASRAPAYAVTHDGKTDTVALRMELPGVAVEDLTVTLENDALLRIQGKRRVVSGEEMEFDQSFQLEKDVDPTSLTVVLQHGILEVTAAKKSKTVKQIPVQTIATERRVAITESTDEASSEQVEAEAISITEDP